MRDSAFTWALNTNNNYAITCTTKNQLGSFYAHWYPPIASWPWTYTRGGTGTNPLYGYWHFDFSGVAVRK